MANELINKELADIDAKANDYLNALGFKFSEKEGKRFLEICRAFQLNPFKREIYGIQGWDKDDTGVLTIIVGYEVYLKRAERTGKWAGLKKSVEFDKDNNLISATIKVFRKDWAKDMPLEHTVYFREFARYKINKETKKKELMKQWAEMPVFMLQKVAIAQAFRMAFPDEMGGLPYIEEEIHEIEKEGGKPYVEMPKEKIVEAKIVEAEVIKPKALEFKQDDIDGLFTKLQASVNPDELATVWKEHAALIKIVTPDIKAQLTACKDQMKLNFAGFTEG